MASYARLFNASQPTGKIKIANRSKVSSTPLTFHSGSGGGTSSTPALFDFNVKIDPNSWNFYETVPSGVYLKISDRKSFDSIIIIYGQLVDQTAITTVSIALSYYKCNGKKCKKQFSGLVDDYTFDLFCTFPDINKKKPIKAHIIIT